MEPQCNNKLCIGDSYFHTRNQTIYAKNWTLADLSEN